MVQNNKNNAIKMGFRVDTMGLLTEICDAGLNRNMGILKLPLNIFKNILGEVAERAIIFERPRIKYIDA